MTVDWAHVYRETYPELVRFLHRMVWDADRARDLAQDAFARSLQQSPENPRAWVFRVAANLARDEARTAVRRKRHLVLIKGEAEAQQEAASGVDEDLERQERIESVRRALDRLSDRDREALLLWNAGLDYKEIAEATGLSPGAVGTTLSRARRRLVDAFDALEKQHVAR